MMDRLVIAIPSQCIGKSTRAHPTPHVTSELASSSGGDCVPWVVLMGVRPKYDRDRVHRGHYQVVPWLGIAIPSQCIGKSTRAHPTPHVTSELASSSSGDCVP